MQFLEIFFKCYNWLNKNANLNINKKQEKANFYLAMSSSSHPPSEIRKEKLFELGRYSVPFELNNLFKVFENITTEYLKYFKDRYTNEYFSQQSAKRQ
jgi:hypothetical protein